jgi:chromosome partitioning protein
MGKIISVANQKGGVGKSTTAYSLGQGLMNKEYRVLFVDLDPQGNLSFLMQAPEPEEDIPSIMDVLTKKGGAAEAIRATEMGDIIPSTSLLSGADIVLSQTGKEYRLKEALEPLKEEYDFIIVDTPPALGILTINALTASNGVIVPAQADIFSLQGIIQLKDTIQAVKDYTNKDLIIKGILLTRFISRSILSRDMADMLEQTAKHLNTKVYQATIRESVAIKESQAMQQDIFSYAPKSNPAHDYKAFVDEFLQEEGEP